MRIPPHTTAVTLIAVRRGLGVERVGQPQEAPLARVVGDAFAHARLAAVEAMFTIWPPPSVRSAGSAARVMSDRAAQVHVEDPVHVLERASPRTRP